MANGDLTCPFLNSQCTKTSCELWDTTNNSCGFNRNLVLLNSIKTNTDDAKTKLDTLITNTNDIKTKLDTMKNNQDQVKNKLDSLITNTDQVENKLDSAISKLDDIEDHTNKLSSSAEPLPAASVLANESFNGQDMDKDPHNYIYLKDFVIEDSDDKPKILKDLENGVEGIDQLPKLTWSEYFTWYQDKTLPFPNPH